MSSVPRSSASTSALTVKELFELALGHQQRNELPQSEALLRKIMQVAPRFAPALHLLGVIAHQSGKTEIGIKLLMQAVEIAPNEAQFMSNLGEMHRRLGHLEEATALGRRALVLAPQVASVHSNLGIALYDCGKLDQAKACQEQALTLDPHFAPALNNLGSILRDQKDKEGAIAFYRKASMANPDYIESISNLGSLLTECDQPEEALKVLLPLIKAHPHYAEAHCNIGTAFAALEQFEKAFFGFKRTLELKPNEDKALIGMARVLQEQRKLPEAQEAAEQALALAPHKAEAHSILGSILAEAGYPENSDAAYKQAITLNSELISAYLGRGHLRMENGDIAGAKSDFLHALSIDADNLGARLALAQVAKVKEGDDNMAALVAAGANVANTQGSKAISLHFGLGKCYEDTKQYDLAFQHYQTGCSLKRKRIDYSADNTDLIGDNIRKIFTEEKIDRLQGAGCNSNVPIFVLGMPRSGTTLTETILASHPLVYGAGELHDIIQVGSQPRKGGDLGYPLNMEGITQNELTEMGQRYIDGLKMRAPDSPRITDKMPANFNFIGLIHLMLPNAKIVHVRRNAVDTCLSGFTRLFNRSQNHSYDLREIGRYYRNYAITMDHWRKVLPTGAFYEIQYEELVADQEGQARALLEYCGLEWNDACMDFHKTERSVRTASVTQVRQPIYTSSVEKWRNYEKHLGPLLEELADLGQR